MKPKISYFLACIVMLVLATAQAYFAFLADVPSFYISAAVSGLCSILLAIFSAAHTIAMAIYNARR